ncbi:MAG TPA: hypothetical protein VFX30_13200 [bacterium]|nr:hypothetical protein [bacterium]
MSNPPIVKPDVKKVDYNYSWPVPARKPKPTQKKNASNDKPGNKLRSRINRTTV